jgi:hypothetical protein
LDKGEIVTLDQLSYTELRAAVRDWLESNSQQFFAETPRAAFIVRGDYGARLISFEQEDDFRIVDAATAEAIMMD